MAHLLAEYILVKSPREKIVKATALLMGLQFLDQGTGLVKQMVIAAIFGTSAAMDAYLVAATIVGLILAWVSLPINQVLIPMFRYDLAREGESAAWANVSTLFNNLTILLLAITVIWAVASPYLVALVAPGFDPEVAGLASSLTRISVIAVFFMGIAGILSQIFLSYERFFLPGVVGVLDNVVGIVVLFLVAQSFGIYGLAAAIVLGAASQFLFQVPILWEKRHLVSRQVNFTHSGMLEMGKLSFPLLVSVGGTQFARVTDRVFASLLTAGSLTALSFAHRLINLMFEFFIRTMQRSTYTHFTKLIAEGNFVAFSRQLFHYLRLVFFLTLPLAIGIMVMPDSIIEVLFRRGAFDKNSVMLTSQALLFYAIGFPAAAMSTVLDRTFFSLKDTRTPTKLALLRIGIKIALAFFMIKPLGHRGLALAESLSQIIRIPFLIIALPPQVRGDEGWKTLGSFGRTAGLALLMGGVVYFAELQIGGLLPLILEVAALGLLGIIVFALLALLFRSEESRTLISALDHLRWWTPGKTSTAGQ